MGGIGTPGGYLAAGVIYLLLAAGFTAMSRYVQNAGAFYAYISAGLNRRLGAGAALAALLSYAIICIGFYGALGFFGNLTLTQIAAIDIP